MKNAIALGVVFFILGLITLTHYGINWDTINHLPRGQAYLHFFLTGKHNYSDLPNGEWYWQNPKSLGIDANIPFNKITTKSVYQIDDEDFNYFMKIDGDGHPPLSDILSSIFNRVLFGKLRLINDIDAYRVYGVLLASLLVGLVFYWADKVYGRLAAFVSAISLALYPLFWSEMHFNTEKDVPETVYWSFMLFCVWKGITEKKIKWIIGSGILFGLALGTKFNIFFIPFVIFPWLVVYLLRQKRNLIPGYLKKIFLGGIPAALIGVVIFFASWPYLWPDPIERVQQVFRFYRRLGVASNPDLRYFGPFGISTYPTQWILYTTPIIILTLSIIGIFFVFRRFKREKDNVSLLFLLWLVIPVARISWHDASIYGGIRQIMEYVPAMAILAGLGASSLYKFVKLRALKILILLFIVIGFFNLTLKLHEIHPNENQFFNVLIGGLKGAKEKDFSFWGFTLGAPYREGIEWINDHAETGSDVVFAYELIPNIPRLWVRPGLSLNNGSRSGYLQNGEYAISLRYQGIEDRSYYDTYLDKYINPVFTADVDGVSVLNVWKNDKNHLKTSIDEELVKGVNMIHTKFGLTFDIGKSVKLWRLEIDYKDTSCKPLVEAHDETSNDGNSWKKIRWTLPEDWRISYLGEQPKKGHFIEPFVGQDARFVNLFLNPLDTCLSQVTNFKIYKLK